MAIRRRYPIKKFIFRCNPSNGGQDTIIESRYGEVRAMGLILKRISENSGKRREGHTIEKSWGWVVSNMSYERDTTWRNIGQISRGERRMYIHYAAS
jgi:hypothetical protein